MSRTFKKKIQKKRNRGLQAMGKKNPQYTMSVLGILKRDGDDLLSHIVTHAVPSALKSLTTVFGMGTGGASSLWSPKNI